MKHMSASRDPEASQVRIGKRKPFSIRVNPRCFDRYEMLRGDVVVWFLEKIHGKSSRLEKLSLIFRVNCFATTFTAACLIKTMT